MGRFGASVGRDAVIAAMQNALSQLSTYYDARPEAVFQRILEILTQQYGPTMAMINVQDGERIRYRAAVNVHPALHGMDSIALENSY
jgi:hypothetical protein